jgi:hypothetical protein
MVRFIRYSRIANAEWDMALKPQDVYVVLKLVAAGSHRVHTRTSRLSW